MTNHSGTNKPEPPTVIEHGAPARHNKAPSGMIFLGLGLLIVAVITAIISLVGVRDFGHGYDVSGGKEYHLLATEDALNAHECQLTDEHGEQLTGRIETADLKFDENDPKISDVSLPLTKNKGVYTTIKFTEDIPQAKYTCDQGNIYISKYSSGTLQALRWITMLSGAAGVAILILAMFFREQKKKAQGK